MRIITALAVVCTVLGMNGIDRRTMELRKMLSEFYSIVL